MALPKLNLPAHDCPDATILIVEDDPILRFGLAMEIGDAGFRVREAANADEAEAVLDAGVAVDVVVTDIQMPGSRDGLALAKTVRAFRPTTKVIVTSGILPKTGIVGVADAYFGKPYDTERLIHRIRSLLANAA
jgi:DNA-binding response OmpR family regulator